MAALTWARRAACLGTDPEMWFPERGEQTQPLRDICMECPVWLSCLEECFRFNTNEDVGFFGRTSAKERRQLRRKARLAALANPPAPEPEVRTSWMSARTGRHGWKDEIDLRDILEIMDTPDPEEPDEAGIDEWWGPRLRFHRGMAPMS
jgi:WhiB family redox-sensing transcriptional regulator